MKTYHHLYDEICSFENLLLAAEKAQRGKRFQNSVARFNLGREEELLRLQEELRTQTYRPGPYREFTIYDAKPRRISAAPYRDRVVHHALCNVIVPIFERTFIFDSYACRLGKGQHAAVDRFTEFCRQNCYVLKGDIRKYFPSIDHEILKAAIRRKIRDARTLWLIDTILDGSNPQEEVRDYYPGDDLFTPLTRRKGIPLGNLTSQFFANVYLNPFDHFVKEELGCRYYIRYVDDFVVLDDDKRWLQEIRAEAQRYLAGLRLTVHPRKFQVFPTACGTDFLGYVAFPTHRRLRRANAWGFTRRLKRMSQDYRAGRMALAEVRQRVASWIGHASHANTYRLREAIFRPVTF